MKKKSETIVFFGSGPVAAESLSLLQKHASIEAVITKPSTAREMADVAPGISQYLVKDRVELDSLISTQRFLSDVGVLIDFGIIISQKVINSFHLGIINSHFSILPEWRGADPISFSILSGQNETGVSLMLLVEKMDEGPIISYGVQPLDGTETTPQLTKRLIALSDALLEHELPRYISGEGRGGASQEFISEHSGKKVSYSRKLTKQDGLLDWGKPAAQLEREVRAFIEWPKSRTILANKDVVITSCRVAPIRLIQGQILVEDKQLYIGCAKDSLEILRLKPAGKNEMTTEAFLAGHRHLIS